jgi:hypothetical protein
MPLSKIKTEGLSVSGDLAKSADLALVAFDSIRADNRSALKMDNAFVDQFEDATGIDTTSTTARNASEYVATDGTTTSEYHPFADETWSGGNVTADNTLGYTVNNSSTAFRSTATGSGYAYTTTTTESNAKYEFEFQMQQKGGGSGPNFGFFVNKNNGTSGIDYTGSTTTARGTHATFNINRDVGDRFKMSWDGRASGNEDIITSSNDYDENGTYENEVTTLASGGYLGSAFTTTDASSIGWFCSAWKDSGSDWIIALKAGTKIAQGTVASGNFTSTTQSAPANVSKVSIIVMYEDNVGTAALNTDLVAQVSADGGSNYSTVTLAAAPNLTSTIKVAKSEAIAVTAGNQPKYKINFANQNSSSKVTRVLGVSLLY